MSFDTKRNPGMTKTTLDKIKAFTENMEAEKVLEAPTPAPIEPEQNFSFELGDLKDLLLLGRKEEDVKIGNFLFKVSSLSSEEIRDVTIETLKLEKDKRLANTATYMAAASLRSVNGVKIEELDLVKNIDTSEFYKKLIFISKLQSGVVSMLIEKYYEIDKKAKEVLSATDVGSAIKK